MNEELLRSLKGEWKCVYSQNGWCTLDKMTEEGHIRLTGQCNGYEDGEGCRFKETPEDIG
ncbi:MAG: hypothetical protein JXA98_02775 [Methanosarcinaceae archaeon]|nr:hypothetical protein [Methanosarcinaceae archaeon]